MGGSKGGTPTVAERLKSLSSRGVCYVLKKGYRK